MADALLWQTEDKLRCDCGLPADETTAAGKDNHYDAEPVVCHACAARDRAQRAWEERKGDKNGIRWRIRERG